MNEQRFVEHNSTNPTIRFDDLEPGVPVLFQVIAMNRAGESGPSATSVPVTPDEVPGPPGRPTAAFVPGQPGAIQLDWTASENRGSAIDAYFVEVSVCASGVEELGNATSFTWTGLPNGEECSFRVTSRNLAGNSLPSTNSATECAVEVPGAPGQPTVVRGDKEATVSWAAPANPDCQALLGYEILRFRNGAQDGPSTPVPFGTNTWTSAPLLNGENYSFQVRAENRQDWGDVSINSDAVTPCGVPLQTPAPDAEPGDQFATVTRTADADANGCEVTQYLVRVNGGAEQPLPANGVIAGLVNGTSYSFSVAGVNEIGVGEFSQASSAVVPFGLPGAPQVGLSPPEAGVNFFNADDNGSPVIRYEFAGAGREWFSDSDLITVQCVNGQGDPCIFLEVGAVQAPPTACLQTAGTSTVEAWAVNAAGAGERASSTFQYRGCPSQPTLNASMTDGQISASWSRPADTEAIYLEINGDIGSPRNGTSATVNAANGRNHTVRVWACNFQGCANSGTQTVRFDPPVPEISLGRGGAFVGGSCGQNDGCEYITGSGSNFTPGSEFWVRCGDFVNTQANDPVVYADRFVGNDGRLNWGDRICGNNFATTVEVWTSAGDRVTASIGAP